MTLDADIRVRLGALDLDVHLVVEPLVVDAVQREVGAEVVAFGAAALVVANSPAGPAYAQALDTYIGPLSLRHWVNDAAMAVF